MPLPSLLTLIVTPGTTAPCASLTTPEIVPVVICASCGGTKQKSMKHARMIDESKRVCSILHPTFNFSLNFLSSLYKRKISVLQVLIQTGQPCVSRQFMSLTKYSTFKKKAV